MHRDLDIEFPEYDEPTHVPTGDECEHSARGENCGRTDCYGCGEDAAAWLVAAAWAGSIAASGVGAIVALAREVNRVAGSSAQYAVTGRDLARLRDRGPERAPKTWSRSWAWAEGVLDAVSGRRTWLQRHDYEHDANAQAAYMVGRLLVEYHLLNEHLTQLEAQAMADADVTSAAGAPSAPSAIPTHGRGHSVESGPGFESRAQHRARSGC